MLVSSAIHPVDTFLFQNSQCSCDVSSSLSIVDGWLMAGRLPAVTGSIDWDCTVLF